MKNKFPPKRYVFISTLVLLFIGTAGVISSVRAGGSSTPEAAVPQPTGTHMPSFASVGIPKPTYTAMPPTATLPAPTSSLSTSSAESVAAAEIVSVNEQSASGGEAPTASPAYSGNKYILVDISEQHMYVYEGDTLVFSFIASTGIHNGTRIGTFSVLDKIPNAYGATWNIWMPNWLGIYWSGSLENGIHALPILPGGSQLWDGYLGTPISYGCIVLSAYDSLTLYDWAEVGTPVEIQR
jgi:lipoprotein-anchoring transpeptidase ErfK/SrfK